MKVQEVIDLIDNSTIYSLAELEWDYLSKCKCVARGLDFDEHRWYSIATNVYECKDGFVGVRGAHQSFSERQTWEDINVLCTAEEYVAIPSITYKPKK